MRQGYDGVEVALEVRPKLEHVPDEWVLVLVLGQPRDGRRVVAEHVDVRRGGAWGARDGLPVVEKVVAGEHHLNGLVQVDLVAGSDLCR